MSKYRVTKTIRITREYDDIEDKEDLRNGLDFDIEADQFALLIACYFKSSPATVRRID